MLKSKFQNKAYIVLCLTILVLALLAYFISSAIQKRSIDLDGIIDIGAFILAGAFLLFSELRRRIVSVSIDHQSISYTNYAGLGKRRYHWWYELDGYILTKVSMQESSYEYISLIREGKTLFRIVEFYHDNYEEIKLALESQTKCIEERETNLLDELLEVISS